MAISGKEAQKWAILGGIYGLAAPKILQLLVTIFSKAGTGGAQAVIPVTVTGIPGQFARWLIGQVTTISVNAYIMAAVVGAVTFVMAAYVADAFNQLKGDAMRRVAVVLFTASLLGVLLVISQGIPTLWAILGFGINAVIMALLITWIDATFKLKLVP